MNTISDVVGYPKDAWGKVRNLFLKKVPGSQPGLFAWHQKNAPRSGPFLVGDLTLRGYKILDFLKYSCYNKNIEDAAIIAAPQNIVPTGLKRRRYKP